MSNLQGKDRYIRIFPGRLRIEFKGLLHRKESEYQLIEACSAIPGVQKVEPSATTGRVLIVFDEAVLPGRALLNKLEKLEHELSVSAAGQRLYCEEAPASSPAPCWDELLAKQEAAVTAEMSSGTTVHESRAESFDSAIRDEDPAAAAVLDSARANLAGSSPRPPFPLTLAMGGLVILGAKQLLFGRSALARSPAPFFMSGWISFVTGYPFLRRGFYRMARDKRLNPDLLLGTAALGLALIRENLVVLGAISILQYVNWKNHRSVMSDMPEEALPDEVQSYSEKAAKWGLAAAGATLLLTRSPIRSIAVLLAANPRPATLPAQAAWQQAELRFKTSRAALPSSGSLPQLARTRTLLLSDTSAVFRSDIQEIECIAHEEDPDKIICISAALLEKSSHPWKDEIREKAKRTCRTLRKAFQIEEQPNGMKGIIHHITYRIGSLAYCRNEGIPFESYYLEAKRMENKGYEVFYVAKETMDGQLCLGIVGRLQQVDQKRLHLLQSLQRQQFKLAFLQHSGDASRSYVEHQGFSSDWLDLQAGEVMERIAALHHQNDEVLLVVDETNDANSQSLRDAGVPCTTWRQLEAVLQTRSAAKHIEAAILEHLQWTKKWNVWGAGLAAIGSLSAPVVNLAGDAMSLLFLSRTHKIAEAALGSSPASGKGTAMHEAAAAVETVPWHELPWESITEGFGVHYQKGLSAVKANHVLSRVGKNELETKKSDPWLISYLDQFKQFPTLMLLGTSAVALFTGGLFDGLVMGAVLLANAAISTLQERKAEQVVQRLNPFQPPPCRVIRDGVERTVSALELVPGDIVTLEPGDRVPADIRLIRSWTLEVNEAALTGESLPVRKHEEPVKQDCPLAERSNMLYMGTDVSRGKALGLVVQTGKNTELGHLTSLLRSESKALTPLQHKVTSISKAFMKWALLAGGLVFVTGIVRGVPLSQIITTSITLAASAIPEGLPVTITIALSAGIVRMSKKKALVRKLSALETLGRTTMICTDKTGTLTKNEMTVKEIRSVARSWHVNGSGYEPAGRILEASVPVRAQPELDRMLLISSLCTNSKLVRKDRSWTVHGDPTEGALLVMAAKGGLNPEQLTDWHRGAEIPFDSGTGKMSVVCREGAAGSSCYVFSKGSVEAILRHCSRYQQEGECYPLTDSIRSRIMQQTDTLAGQALRVLAFAYRPLTADEHEQQASLDEKDMIYVGMAGMMDPPKADVEHSILEARKLGVKPVMITGDHPITAIAIARQLHISHDASEALSGHELDRMNDAELDLNVERITVYARMTPEHKLRIVKALQRKGHIITMTGDGVNDSPAMKQADVGIAMGQQGTEVSKGIADIVLTEDHFSSIIDGVKEGRTIIGNIREALGCLLTGNLAEIFVTSAAVMAGMPVPLVPIQILLMNLLTDALPAMVLAVHPGNKRKQMKQTDIVDRQLYQKVVTRGLLLGIGALGLFTFTLAAGEPVQAAQSVAFASLVTGQLCQTLSWRQEGADTGDRRGIRQDRFLLGAMAISSIALLAVLYVPQLSRFFHTSPIALRYWGPILAVAASIPLISRPLLKAVAGGGTEPQAALPSYGAA